MRRDEWIAYLLRERKKVADSMSDDLKVWAIEYNTRLNCGENVEPKRITAFNKSDRHLLVDYAAHTWGLMMDGYYGKRVTVASEATYHAHSMTLCLFGVKCFDEIAVKIPFFAEYAEEELGPLKKGKTCAVCRYERVLKPYWWREEKAGKSIYVYEEEPK